MIPTKPSKIEDFKGKELTGSLQENLAFFQQLFAKDEVLRVRELSVNRNTRYDCTLLFMDGMVNGQVLNESVIRPLLLTEVANGQESVLDYVKKQILFACEVDETTDLMKMLQALLYGDSLLLFEGTNRVLIIDVKGWKTRGIDEPQDERILQGPREGFNESVLGNVALIRRKLTTPDLCVQTMRLGKRTDTQVFLCYLDSLADPRVVSEVKKRLGTIDIDGVLDANYIVELIKDSPYSLLKTTGATERPDTVVGKLLEGRVAILVDGTPVVITVPYLFVENFQSDDDYYINFYYASVGRILRIISFFLAISVPAIYISLITYHKELLPTSLALSISAARSGVPFPVFVECIMLLIVFEILKETGLRMPQSVGHALSIVGGLVVGQAAVEAKLVSAPMVIVIALAGITGLMIPRLKGMIVYARVGLILLATMFGLYGYFFGISALLIHIYSLRSIGVDYTGYLTSLNSQQSKDTAIRAPWWKMRTRPDFLTKNHVRNRSKRGERI